ncbi:hypothetical protein I4U23_016550 [Adineta vaga]|nr:hypothetical protein I4U23_016550 [Adineta vaga]
MQKISQLVWLTILLVLVTKNDMARARTLGKMNRLDFLNYLLSKRGPPDCLPPGVPGNCGSTLKCCPGSSCRDFYDDLRGNPLCTTDTAPDHCVCYNDVAPQPQPEPNPEPIPEPNPDLNS